VWIDDLGTRPILIGMLHLSPLPGSPRGGTLAAAIEGALRDAEALEAAGFDALLVENLGDVPYVASGAGPETIAALTRVACEVRRRCALPLGVNVLRNDGPAALAIACACGGAFIRVNVHAGACLTDQGIVTGEARRTLLLRRALGAEVAIVADVAVKHAAPLALMPLEVQAADLVERALADGLIISGPRTGSPPDLGCVDALRRAAPGVPILAGSGISLENAAAALPLLDGAIVGTSVKEGGVTTAPVSRAAAARLVEVARALRRG
jgi:hypothetical protein